MALRQAIQFRGMPQTRGNNAPSLESVIALEREHVRAHTGITHHN